MNVSLPAGFLTIEPARLPANEPEADYSRDDDRDRVDYESTTFPERCATGTPSELTAKLYGCSGSLGTTRYKEASKFRDLPSMDWADARLALSRLIAGVRDRYSYQRGRCGATSRDLVALAEFALTARGFDFLGKKGENAPKFRKELAEAGMLLLRPPLLHRLTASAHNSRITANPITETMSKGWEPNDALQARVPVSDGVYVRIIYNSKPEEARASLEFMRHWLAKEEKQRGFADYVDARLSSGNVTAAEYAQAMNNADGLAFMSAKLVALYYGIMHSMPIYRLYPATSESEAFELWWPWGRAMPLIDGGPTKAPITRKRVLDPGIITAKRPQDVVREVMQRTGINRTTAQRMTAKLRAEMRRERKALALSMLRRGATRAEVARAVCLSPSRISAMFKGSGTPEQKGPGRFPAAWPLPRLRLGAQMTPHILAMTCTNTEWILAFQPVAGGEYTSRAGSSLSVIHSASTRLASVCGQ